MRTPPGSFLSILGSAATLLPTFCLAATDLTLYGTVDSGLAVTRVQGQGSQVGLISGGQADSLFGLRGTETLDSGLAAIFQLESGIDLNSGRADDETRLFNYEAWVGLRDNDLGEFRMGRQHRIGQQFGSELEIAGWKDFGLGATFKASDNYQTDNTINLYSPDFSGLRLGLGYSFSAGGKQGFSTSRNNRALSAGVWYENGPFTTAATYDRLQLNRQRADSDYTPQAVQVGASYDFEIVKLSVAWSRQKNGYVGLNGADYPDTGDGDTAIGLGPQAFVRAGRLDAWYAGAQVPFGPGRVLVQASIARPNWRASDSGQRAPNAQAYSLGYVVDLSPRTSVYSYVGQLRHIDLDNGYDQTATKTVRVAAGLTHQF